MVVVQEVRGFACGEGDGDGAERSLDVVDVSLGTACICAVHPRERCVCNAHCTSQIRVHKNAGFPRLVSVIRYASVLDVVYSALLHMFVRWLMAYQCLR